ncbi:MAG: hypothetical protein HY646_11190 [Acidobacteria bacterium]|nr:hypothetical protein [Acidobacteriota bacterium]
MKSKVLLWGHRRAPRRWKTEALIMAGAGSAIGALTAGRKGAAIGAASGGLARLIMRWVS